MPIIQTALPLVSIVIPVYNGANCLRQAIDSALAQTYPVIEVLVINDGSTDGGETERIARSYGDRIRYFAKENGGVASALNRGIREMRGEYFSWLSHDDVFRPEKTALQVEFLRRNGSSMACYSDYARIDASGRTLGYVVSPWFPAARALRELFTRQYINGSTVMARREALARAGPFDETLRYTQDMEMWFRLLRQGDLGRVPGFLAGWRSHAAQGSRETGPHQREALAVLERLLAELGEQGLLDRRETADERERLARRQAWFARAVSRGRGWHDAGAAHLRQALQIWPSWRNPARAGLALNRLSRLHHAARRMRVRIVHSLAGLARSLGLWHRRPPES